MKKVILILGLFIIIGLIVWVSVGKKDNVNQNERLDSYESTVESSEEELVVNEGNIPIPLSEVEEKENNIKINTEDNKKIMQAIFHTNKGDITIEFSESTPKTVENFVTLAKQGFYDGTKFHRVIKGFMNQGGDPLSKDDSKTDYWGTGGPGYKFADEINSNNKNDVYTLSMANAGANTNGSQFFINVANNNFLDTKHTVFGKVISGKEVVDDINNTPTGPNDRPIEPVIIKNITLK